MNFSVRQVLIHVASAILFCTAAVSQKPNVIMILTDDMGYADLGCYGMKRYATSRIDQLFGEGAQFMSSYSAGPMCTPTRTALMTGRYPARTTVGLIEPLSTRKRDTAYGLTSEIPSLGLYLQRAGYETRLVGKWHLGFLKKHSPLSNGFDSYFGFMSGAADYISHSGDGRTPDLYRNDTAVQVDGYLTDLFTGEAVEFISGRHSRPFFLLLNYNAPHWPWQGPHSSPYPDSMDYTAGGSPEIYAEMMTALDQGIGRILDALKQNHLDSTTLVIFTNDNGGERYSDNGLYRNGKMTLWEGGLRVPAAMRWTGHVPPGTRTFQTAITMDWTATILAAAGIRADPAFPLDGMNLMPWATGKKKNVDRKLYWRTFQRSKQKAMREGRWKYLRAEGEEHLFDLHSDPSESTDLKASKSGLFRRLKKDYARWEQTVLTPIPMVK